MEFPGEENHHFRHLLLLAFQRRQKACSDLFISYRFLQLCAHFIICIAVLLYFNAFWFFLAHFLRFSRPQLHCYRTIWFSSPNTFTCPFSSDPLYSNASTPSFSYSKLEPKTFKQRLTFSNVHDRNSSSAFFFHSIKTSLAKQPAGRNNYHFRSWGGRLLHLSSVL